MKQSKTKPIILQGDTGHKNTATKLQRYTIAQNRTNEYKHKAKDRYNCFSLTKKVKFAVNFLRDEFPKSINNENRGQLLIAHMIRKMKRKRKTKKVFLFAKDCKF